MNQFSPLSVAQITDIHLFADENQALLGIPTIQSFEAVIKRLKQIDSEIDLLLVTGDLSGDGTPGSYENLQAFFNQLQIPTYWLPGDHDSAKTIDQYLNLGLVSRRKCFERGGWNFILLNSSIPGQEQGYLSTKTLSWLEKQLETVGDSPTVVALHHPPFPVDSKWLDNNNLENPEEFFQVLDRHPQVKLVLFGHIHQEFQQQRGSVSYLGTPSTSIQFRPKTPSLTIDSKSPGFRLLKLYPNGVWESYVERVDYYNPLDIPAMGY